MAALRLLYRAACAGEGRAGLPPRPPPLTPTRTPPPSPLSLPFPQAHRPPWATCALSAPPPTGTATVSRGRRPPSPSLPLPPRGLPLCTPRSVGWAQLPHPQSVCVCGGGTGFPHSMGWARLSPHSPGGGHSFFPPPCSVGWAWFHTPPCPLWGGQGRACPPPPLPSVGWAQLPPPLCGVGMAFSPLFMGWAQLFPPLLCGVGMVSPPSLPSVGWARLLPPLLRGVGTLPPASPWGGHGFSPLSVGWARFSPCPGPWGGRVSPPHPGPWGGHSFSPPSSVGWAQLSSPHRVRQRPGAGHGHALHHRPGCPDPAVDGALPRPVPHSPGCLPEGNKPLSASPPAQPPARLWGAGPPEPAVTPPPRALSSRPGHDAELPFPGAGHHQLPL